MAMTDTGPLGTLTLISVEEVDSNETGTPTHLRVRFSLDKTSATETLLGFLLWHDDGNGVTVPVWVDAIEMGLAGGGDGSDPLTVYEALAAIPMANQAATWHETFEEYANAENVAPLTLDKGGAGWDGAWVISDIEIGYIGYRDSFESYSIGAVGTLNGGRGFSGPWVIRANG